MNRSHLRSILALAGFFILLLGLFTWSRINELRNFLDPSAAEAEIARLEAGTPSTITLPPIRPTDPARGSTSTDALEVIEFADFNCLTCRLMEPEIRLAMQAFPTQARLVWRDLPLNADQADGLLPSLAARCAQDQGKFWEMHDALFATAKLDRKGVSKAAQTAGLETTAFENCVNAKTHVDELKKEVALARSSGLSTTPSFFIGNQVVTSFVKAQELANLIGQILDARAQTGR
jgi:protein-disulfide isomerase